MHSPQNVLSNTENEIGASNLKMRQDLVSGSKGLFPSLVNLDGLHSEKVSA